MNIRKFAESVGFKVIGKLRYMGKWKRLERYYMDEAQNIYILDTDLGAIRIKPYRKG